MWQGKWFLALCAVLVCFTVTGADGLAALRQELRAFYPEYGQFSGPVKDPRQKASCARIEEELKSYIATHPDYDALDLRRETYLLMRRHFVPFLFKNSPFYFEAGINGGWSGCCPSSVSVVSLPR